MNKEAASVHIPSVTQTESQAVVAQALRQNNYSLAFLHLLILRNSFGQVNKKLIEKCAKALLEKNLFYAEFFSATDPFRSSMNWNNAAYFKKFI